MKNLLLLLAISVTLALPAQNLPVMKTINGGSMNLGGGYQFSIHDYYMVLLGNDDSYAKMTAGQTPIGEVPGSNNPERRVTVASFYLSETEVTNAQYHDFLIDSLLSPADARNLRSQLKATKSLNANAIRAAWAPLIAKAAETALLPDTNCWATDFVFASNEPLVRHYLWHPAFDNYPVVGVSWAQAKAYCAWLTATANAERARKQLPLRPAYRLPTEGEWEYAAREYVNESDNSYQGTAFPWKGNTITDEKGQFRANIKTGPGEYIGDNYEYTAPVKAFPANSKGLYEMAGNVSEWCEDVFRVHEDEHNPAIGEQRQIRLFEAANASVQVEQRVVKGGSWAELSYGAMSGSRMGWPETKGGSRIGFRVAQTKLACECKDPVSCKHSNVF